MPRKTPPGRKPKPRKYRLDRRLIDLQLYKVLLDSFRKHSGDAKAVAIECKISGAVVREAWAIGWVDLIGPMAQPIKDVYADEQANVRAELARIEEARIETRQEITKQNEALASRDRSRQKAEEVQCVRMVRGNAIGMLGTVGRILQGLLVQGERLQNKIATDKITVQQFLAYAKTTADIARSAADCGRVAIQLERLCAGSPTEIVGHTAVEATEGEALTDLQLATVAYGRAQRAGLVPGVAAEPLAIEAIDVESSFSLDAAIAEDAEAAPDESLTVEMPPALPATAPARGRVRAPTPVALPPPVPAAVAGDAVDKAARVLTVVNAV